MKDLDWNNLRVALAVSRGGSLTKAANLLGLDQTTAGRRLTTLEAQLETPLFIRSKTGFIPTDDGRKVIEHAARVEDQITRLTEDVAAPKSSVSGVVRVMGNTWMLERLATYLPELTEQNAALELRFSGQLPPAPIHGEATISFWFDAQERSPETSVAFARVPYAAYTSATKEVAPSDWVQFRDDDAQGPSFSREMRRRLGPDANVRMTATDARILMAAVASGVGQGVLPTCLGDIEPTLKRSDANVGRIDRVLRCHVNPDTARTARMRAVLAWISRILPDALNGDVLEKPGRR